MKTIFAGIALIVCIAGASTALSNPQGNKAAAKNNTEHIKWVQRCLADIDGIKTGMTRREVESRFPMDGGLQTVSPVRFTHPQCPYFKIDVEFEFKKNSADQNRAIRGKQDKVKRVSKPYIETPNID